MPIGYLVTVALAAAATLLALSPPPRRFRMLARISWLLGTASNAPFVFCLVLVAATALAIGSGDIDSPGAWAVVGAAVLTMAGLVVVAGRGLWTSPAVERALSQGLGPDWAAAVDAGIAARPHPRLPLARMVLWPFPWFPRPGAVERVKNIRYGDAGTKNLLDLYRNRSQPSGAPTLVYVHGGGFFSGRKSFEARPLIHRLARHGWVCISANYRLRPAASFPDHLIDLKKVIAWVRDRGEEYGADPEAVFVAGSSAGGHMAAMAALTPNDPAFQPGFEDADTSVSAAITLYGYLGNYYGQGASSSPGAYIGADAPPFFIAQGDRDTYSPRFVEITRGFVKRLRSTSDNPVIYAELPEGQHSFDLFHSILFEAVIDGIEDFAAWVRSMRVRSRVRYGAEDPAAANVQAL
jgi:acetyl esterase/lipase